jgi:hypothetical protein
MVAHAGNIGEWGRKRRRIMGVAGLTAGVAVVVVVIAAALSPGWALLAFAPFTFGVLGLSQASKST